MAATPEPTTQISSGVHNVNPSEVGWQFVPQYYTFVNKQPNRLHCFYTKNSTFIHGTEGEDGRPCYGQQEIHQRIMQIGFEDCKVFIHSVDSQASANGGIILQVIGEISNRGEAWRKFVQTFFLAQQPNGYFVLNDIFRFLKEESVEDEEIEEHAELEVEAEPATTAVPVEQQQEPAQAPPVKIPSPAPAPVEPTPEPVREPTPEPAPAPVEEPPKQPNGVHQEPEKEPEVPAVQETAPKEEPAPQKAPAHEPTPAPAPVPAPVPAAQPAPSSKPAQPIAQPAPVPARPAAPPAPRTWANTAKADANKWGNAVATDARGTSIEGPAAATPSPPPSQPPRSNTQTPSGTQHRGPHPGPRAKDPTLYNTIMALKEPSAFVKGLVDPITNDQLRSLLVQYGGPIKEIEFLRSRACAFVEFEEVESAKKAMLASLPAHHGGGGGIHVDVGAERTLKISVEQKKDRSERQQSRGGMRGGMNQGGDRGAFRGRGGGGGGAGRGRGSVPSSGKAV